MERKEKLEYQKSIESYFEQKRVYDLFEKLLKELVINKPTNPVNYLIDRIKKKDSKRIFITGSTGTDRKEISLSIADSFGYLCVSLGDLIQKEINKKLDNARKIENKLSNLALVDDEEVIELLRKELIKLEKENSSYIIEGYPRNRVQSMFLQSIGLLPDSLIILTTSNLKLENRIKEKYNRINMGGNPLSEQIIKRSLDDSELNLSAIREVYKGFYCEINRSEMINADVIDEIAKIIRFKNRTHSARRPPKVILLGPPCSRKYEIAEIIAKKFNLCHVSISDLLNKEIRANNNNSSAILNSMNKGELVNDKFIFKLLEDRLYCSDCMINGWILTGFPKNNSQLAYFEFINSAFKPSLVVVIEHDNKILKERSSFRRIDPMTGKIYFVNSEQYRDLNKEISQRLQCKNEDLAEVFEKRLDNWEKFSSILGFDFKYNLKRINGEGDMENLIETIVDSMECASE